MKLKIKRKCCFLIISMSCLLGCLSDGSKPPIQLEKKRGLLFSSSSNPKPSQLKSSNSSHQGCFINPAQAKKTSKDFSTPKHISKPQLTKYTPPKVNQSDKRPFKILLLKKQPTGRVVRASPFTSKYYKALTKKQSAYLAAYRQLMQKYKNDPKELRRQRVSLKNRLLK